MYEITITVLFLAGILVLLDMSISLKRLVSFKGVETKLMVGEDVEEISDYEREKRMREMELDNRVKQLQAEIESSTYGTPAEVTMQGIYNIPHNEVRIKSNIPDVEIAD